MNSQLGRAIILDVGGVILVERDRARRHAWEARLGLAHDELTRRVMDSERARHAASGQYSERQVWEAVADQLGIAAEEIPQLQADFWQCEQLDVPLVEYLQSLRPRCKIAILSNAWSDARAIHDQHFQFSRWVDVLVYSAEVHLLKPDPRIYQLALAQLQLPPNECVYVDDREVNVQAAVSLGMCGIVHRDTARTIEEMRAMLGSLR